MSKAPMRITYNPYPKIGDTSGVCVKCGREADATVRYLSGHGVSPDTLELTCKTCGYYWIEWPLDHQLNETPEKTG